MNREEMIEYLEDISFVARGTTMTMDMGLEFEYANSCGCGTSFGNMGDWPLYELRAIDREKLKIICKKIEDKSLSYKDLEGTDLANVVDTINNRRPDNNQVSPTDILLELPDVAENFKGDFYMLCDAGSWDIEASFYPTRSDLFSAFQDNFCWDSESWEDVDDDTLEYWYDEVSGGFTEPDLISFN